MAHRRRCTIAGVASTEVTGLKAFAANSDWLAEEGLRLDATAYVSGGLQARDKILSRNGDCKPLNKVSRIFYEGRFARNYVQNADHGVPFFTASDMTLANLQGLRLLSKKKSPNLSVLQVHSGWTLMSRSGTIGRMVYARGEMEGMSASDDIIRIIADQSEVRPGFLFAFLSGHLAQAMIAQRTYGSVIQHIEPHHIADLPIPLPDKAFAERIHALVESAAGKRTKAALLLQDAAKYFDNLAGPMILTHDHSRSAGIVRSDQLAGRLDAFHHIGWAAEPHFGGGDRIDDIANVIASSRVPRIYVKKGIPFLSGIDIFKLRPTSRTHIAKFIAEQFDACVKRGQLAVQGSGSRSGLIGRVAYIGARMDGWAASHDLFRIAASDAADIARIFAFLTAESGHRIMLKHSYGTAIPHVNPQGIAALRIPSLPQQLVEGAARALVLREEADAEEALAIEEVEVWLN